MTAPALPSVRRTSIRVALAATAVVAIAYAAVSLAVIVIVQRNLTDQIDPTVAAISAMLIGLSLLLVFILDRVGGLRTISK